MTPRVSVILTVYRRTEFIAEALASVLTQSYRDFEVIVVDDSGAAASRHIVASHCTDRPICYVANRSTLGVATSITRAAESARGHFLAILNDDDTWDSELLAELVPPLEADSRRVLAAADHWIMSEDGVIDRERSREWTASFGRCQLPHGDVHSAADFVLNGGAAVNIAGVFRKDAIDWDAVVPAVAGAYDYWIGCLLAKTDRPIYYVPKRLARWREHRAAETRRQSHDKNENLVYVFSTLRAHGWFPEHDTLLRARLADALFAVARDKLRFNRTVEARLALWQCFRLGRRWPAMLRVFLTFLPSPARKLLTQASRRARVGRRVAT